MIYRGWLGQYEPCYNKNTWLNFKYSAKLLKHSTWIFKLSAGLLVFSLGFKSSAECLKISADYFHRNTGMILLVKGHVNNFRKYGL